MQEPELEIWILTFLSQTSARAFTTQQITDAVRTDRRSVLTALEHLWETGQVERVPHHRARGRALGRASWRRTPSEPSPA